jgi:hypothetical protein
MRDGQGWRQALQAFLNVSSLSIVTSTRTIGDADWTERRRRMCDYSLEYVASRPAAVADRLVSTTFPNTITRGFAVCLRPGTEIAFERDVEFENPITHMVTRLPARVARFRKINPGEPCAHHDALEFPGGEIVPLTKLLPGQHAVVLQLPAEARNEAEKPAEIVAERTPVTVR